MWLLKLLRGFLGVGLCGLGFNGKVRMPNYRVE
jgi:hypothetical protein